MTSQEKQTDLAEAGCDSLESTLGLMDGTLGEAEQAAALAHAGSCSMCGPMVRGWEPVGAVLRDHFDDAAERAKPDLARVAERVFEQISPAQTKSAPASGWWTRFVHSITRWQPLTALAAAGVATAVVVLLPGGQPAIAPVPAHHPTAVAQRSDIDSDVHRDLGEVGDESGFHFHNLSFGSAKGMVMTAGDDLPVIWVHEPDGA